MEITKSKKNVTVSRMRAGQARQVADLIRSVILPLNYYTKEARRTEVAKYTPKKLLGMFREDPDSVLVATHNSEIVGFCLSRADDGLIWIDWFGVSRPLRGRGVGHALLSAVEGTAPSRVAHKLWCDSRTINSRSNRLLIKFGFTQIGTARNHWFKHDFIFWEKPVDRRYL